ncbi:transposase, partial [Endozoicomonas sp. SM1973]
MKSPKIETLTVEGFDQLRLAIEQSNLTEAHKALVIGVLELCLWLQQKLTFSQISINNLKKAFGIQSEKRSRGTKPPETVDADAPIEDEPSQGDTTGNTDNIQPKPKPVADKPKRPGHGQLHASAYTAAEVIALNHPDYKAGDPCPTQCGGRLYEIKTPGVFIRIEGGQLFNAYRYEQQRLRCALCGELLKAPRSSNITEKYDERAKAMVAVLKYQLGLPLYRLAQWQQQTGVPIPDTTQWGLILNVYQVAAYIFNALVTLAAQSPLFFQDDTTVKVQSVMTGKEVNP